MAAVQFSGSCSIIHCLRSSSSILSPDDIINSCLSAYKLKETCKNSHLSCTMFKTEREREREMQHSFLFGNTSHPLVCSFYKEGFTLQQDNEPTHTSKTKKILLVSGRLMSYSNNFFVSKTREASGSLLNVESKKLRKCNNSSSDTNI